ncbi:MAG: chemotaxis protein CheD [Desulfobacteraceae bacterium]|nr:chemotaxis protein CheD [Desulfobacteraceae bacterium]
MQVMVGISDMKVSNDLESVLIAYSLGSCIGIVIYDYAAKVGGILNSMLPESKLNPGKAKKNPYMFADTGIPCLFQEAYKLGANKQRMKVLVVGGSQVLGQEEFLNIGKRNNIAATKILHRNNMLIDHSDVGGIVNRTVRLEIKTGDIWIKNSGAEEKKI